MQRETNELNRQMHQQDLDFARETNAFNSAEAQKAREWNSAAQQMQRLQSAGINPFAAAQQVSGSQATNMSASGVSTPSPVPAVAPHADMSAADIGTRSFIGLFSSLAAGMKSIADARKAGVEAKQLIGFYNDQLRRLRAEANVAEHQDGLTALDLKFKNERIALEFKVLDGQAYKAYADAYKAKEEGDTMTYERKLKEAQTEKENALKLLTYEQIRLYDPYMNAQIGELKSRTYKQNAEGKTEDALRGLRADNIQADTAKKKQETENEFFVTALNSLKFKDESAYQEWLGKTTDVPMSDGSLKSVKNRDIIYDNRIFKEIADVEKSRTLNSKQEKEIERLKEDIEHLRKENDAYWWNMVLGHIERLGESGVRIAIALGLIKK